MTSAARQQQREDWWKDPSTIPGAMEDEASREIPGIGILTYEQAPAGWLTLDGKRRFRPWRCYHLTREGDDHTRTRLTSVSTLLDAVCPKAGLPFWAEARGIEGAVEAVRLGLVDPDDQASAANAVAAVRAGRLGADRARDDAAARGLDVHNCLREYMETGTLRRPSLPEHDGYWRALSGWLKVADPEPVAVEQLVCHPEDGYAGRLDLRCRFKGGVLATVDAKTSEKASIFMRAHVQVGLYERAEVRCGGDPADMLMVVVFAGDGSWRSMPADHGQGFVDAALEWAAAARPVESLCDRLNGAEKRARRAA